MHNNLLIKNGIFSGFSDLWGYHVYIAGKGNHPGHYDCVQINSKVKHLFLHSLFIVISNQMNDLPVIGSVVMSKGLWDRQGANIASCQKKMYSEKLF